MNRVAKYFAISAAGALACGDASLLRADCSLTATGTTPLPDAGPRLYQGRQSGLYPRGGNSRPPALAAAALAAAAAVVPLDANGVPDAAAGKIAFISIGMSNTTQEFGSAGSGAFKPRADADPAKNPRLVIVDGAQGGQDSSDWADPNSATWTALASRLTSAGVSPAQVQVAWMKHARRNPAGLGAFPAHAQTFQADLATIARSLRSRYPNLRLIYLSSRTRAYTNAANGLSPEPFAYESGFGVKWLIEDQIAGRGDLNWDAQRGPVVAPLLVWGPYLWADGTTPRSDGFTWLCNDLQGDFTHPSATGGVPKVGSELLAFFKTDATTRPWFLRNSVTGQPPTLTAAADTLSGNVPLVVQFNASASDPDGTITGYQWTFGDGTFATAQNPGKTFTAPGRFEVSVTVTDNSGNTAQQTLPMTVKLRFQEWRQIYFSAAELANPAISGDLADPDGDGIANLAEYALGTNPKQPDAPVWVASHADGQLALTFPRAKFVSEAAIVVEHATSAAGPWTAAADAVSEQVSGDDGVVETVTATDSAAATSAHFLRLRINRISEPRQPRR
ncbi:MAG: PKD domain-containing protein [Verrucomicrobiota bacterium]|nr:PKD domain-containing protein [Verrucomicrobiota bacterium]